MSCGGNPEPVILTASVVSLISSTGTGRLITRDISNLTLNTPDQIPDVFLRQQFFLTESEIEPDLNHGYQVDMRERVPPVDIVGGHLRCDPDIVIIEYFTEYFIQSVLQFHGNPHVRKDHPHPDPGVAH